MEKREFHCWQHSMAIHVLTGELLGGGREYACWWQWGLSYTVYTTSTTTRVWSDEARDDLAHRHSRRRGRGGQQQPRPSLRRVLALGPPQGRCPLPPPPFRGVGVRAHGLIPPPQAREPQ